jgi:hypothetical protein
MYPPLSLIINFSINLELNNSLAEGPDMNTPACQKEQEAEDDSELKLAITHFIGF